MQANDSEPQERSDLPADVGIIGVDGDGETHYYSDHTDTVYLVDEDDDVTFVQELGGQPMDLWLRYVGEERGWECRTWDQSLGAFVHVATREVA